MKRSPKVFWPVLAACSLGLVFLSCAGLLAQDQDQQQELGEPTSQSVDLPPQDTSPAVAPAPEAPALSTDYVIGPEDVLDIDVFNVPELTKTVRVANDGTISLALLGHVRAEGLTTTQLRAELESKWGRTYLENPQVSVFVKEFHTRPVSVIGAVERPGLYQLTAPRTLIEMLSMAGGLAKRSSAPAGRTVYVTRKEGFADFQPVEGMELVASDKVEINLQRLLYSREAALNIEVKPLDIISVSKADVVYVVGEVKRAGGFVLEDRERITVLQALAMAEGLSGTAAKGSARIIRRSQDGSRTEIPVNLSKVLKGKSQDVELAANDILFVPTSAGKAAVKRAADAAIGTVSGILVYRR
jgi:polysaccharide export outer membrane protein